MATLPEKNFDEKNGLLGLDEEIFLYMVQFIGTKLLRKYMGLSEETFQRIKFLNYRIYRIKYNSIINEIFVKQRPEEVGWIYCKEMDVSNWGGKILCTKEPIFDNIFEAKLKYDTYFICVRQIEAYVPWYKAKADSGICYLKKYSKNIQYVFEDTRECKKSIDSKIVHNPGGNILTVILDMRKGQGVLYFKFNDTPLPYALANISHTEKLIHVTIGGFSDTKVGNLTIVSTAFLKHLPKGLEECKHLNSANGKVL
jgi:hypothetical protein